MTEKKEGQKERDEQWRLQDLLSKTALVDSFPLLLVLIPPLFKTLHSHSESAYWSTVPNDDYKYT